MKVFVGCEFSGKVRDAFIRRGHDAVSCDLVPSESDAGPHIQGDVIAALEAVPDEHYDMGIFHPSCRCTACSGNRWYAGTPEREEALEFQKRLWDLAKRKCKAVALEQPRSVTGRVLGPPSQIIHSWQHGHGERKETFLWLHGLKPLEPSNVVEGREPTIHHMSLKGGAAERRRCRSITYTGIAEAMADQWGANTALLETAVATGGHCRQVGVGCGEEWADDDVLLCECKCETCVAGRQAKRQEDLHG